MSPRLVPAVLAACLPVAFAACAAAPEPTPPPAEEAPPEAPSETLRAEPGTTAPAAMPAAARADVETLTFEIVIAAPVAEVWDTMLSPDGYTRWTAPFMAGCYYEGSWGGGERMRFLAPGGSGMVAVIAAHRPHELLSIEHVGYVVNGVEDTTSAGVRSWAPAYETYRFASVEGGTRVTVEQDTLVGMEAYMNATWPEALAALKALCEGD